MIRMANLATHDCSFHFATEINFYAPETFGYIIINIFGWSLSVCLRKTPEFYERKCEKSSVSFRMFPELTVTNKAAMNM